MSRHEKASSLALPVTLAQFALQLAQSLLPSHTLQLVLASTVIIASYIALGVMGVSWLQKAHKEFFYTSSTSQWRLFHEFSLIGSTAIPVGIPKRLIDKARIAVLDTALDQLDEVHLPKGYDSRLSSKQTNLDACLLKGRGETRRRLLDIKADLFNLAQLYAIKALFNNVLRLNRFKGGVSEHWVKAVVSY